MSWDFEKIQRWLCREHDRIYSDLDQMRRKVARDPERYHYSNFISEEEGALIVCILLKDSASLVSKETLKAVLAELEEQTDEQFEHHSLKNELDRDGFRKGWRKKIRQIKSEFLK